MVLRGRRLQVNLFGVALRCDLINILWLAVQVIVKLANIYLTPEKPKYKGGVWHVEGVLCWVCIKHAKHGTRTCTGMENEAIVATGIFYWQQTNITESRLAFRRAVVEPKCDEGDHHGVEEIFGLQNEGALQQRYGEEFGC